MGYSAEKYGDNVEQLIKKLRISKKIEGDILHVRGKYTKIDLVNRLREAGFLCYEWEGYDQLAKDLSFQALNAFKNSKKIILPIFSERSGRLLKDQIPKFDRCHIIAISSAVANVFLDARPASISEAQTPDLVGMRSSTKTVLKNALLE